MVRRATVVKSDAAIPPPPKKSRRKAAAAAGGDNNHHDIHDEHFEGEGHETYPKNWEPPAHLAAPKERSGYVQRWVRTNIRGENDPQNIANQLRQGWRPRSFTTVPASERTQYPSAAMGKYGEVMKSGDLVLCEMPKNLFDQMKVYYANKRRGQVEALVASHLTKTQSSTDAEHGFGEITMSRRSSVTTRKPIVAADAED